MRAVDFLTGCDLNDWEPVVLRKPKPKAKDLRDPKAVNRALRSGGQVQTVKKSDDGVNKRAAATAVRARKLDEAALGRVAAELRQAIQKARLEKGLSQAEPAKLVSERPQVVSEKGRAKQGA
ncbi:hypothetical protein RJ639_034966 [Escallonia herrerae]|uniref:Multiprotein bridging factor 1 N-terminal domain-containing protein n=1 Tax=Escallonia herrerae TaxID=1293975 RepID=A0AA88WQE3_9ASTE|nr:hypothetical protein RJ639_034966 [Escallonia herrerae]